MVALHYQITVDDLRGPEKRRKYAWPRQVVYALAWKESPWGCTHSSLPKIALYFNRDHTSVLGGFRNLEQRAKVDPVLADDLAMFRRLCLKVMEEKDGQEE